MNGVQAGKWAKDKPILMGTNSAEGVAFIGGTKVGAKNSGEGTGWCDERVCLMRLGLALCLNTDQHVGV